METSKYNLLKKVAIKSLFEMSDKQIADLDKIHSDTLKEILFEEAETMTTDRTIRDLSKEELSYLHEITFLIHRINDLNK